MKAPFAWSLLIAVLISACSVVGSRPSPSPSSTPAASAVPTTAVATAGTGTIFPETPNPDLTPTPTPVPTPFPTSQPAGVADLIYALVAELGPPDWCDPDYFPIAHADDVALAREHLAEMQADRALYQTILDHNGIPAGRELTDEEVVVVYRDWKILTRAIVLAPLANGSYAFDYIALQGPEAQQMDVHVAGTISADGAITTTVNEPTTAPNCPICLARGTLISTASGPIPVELLEPGVIVWTTDSLGARIGAPVVKVGSIAVPLTHEIVHLVLADGRTLDVSPGHPLVDGRAIGSLQPGDPLDGSTVLSAQRTAYEGGATFDLLPAGPTGAYWANGILIGSTLAER